jgi:hypothetical protein
MTEAGTNGTAQAAIDFISTKADLTSSSTSRRTTQLRAIDEKIKDHCERYNSSPSREPSLP